MTLYEVPQTLVRLGRFDCGSLIERIRRFREPLTPILFGVNGSASYASFRGVDLPHLVTFSQYFGSVVDDPGHNAILTVTSHSDLVNASRAAEFEADTGLCMDLNVPRKLQLEYDDMKIIFKEFKDIGQQRVMRALRELSFKKK